MNKIYWNRKELIRIISRSYLPAYSSRFFAKSTEAKNKSNDENNIAAKIENTLPKPPPPDTCCGDCCPSCVWLQYVIELKFHFKNDSKKIKEAFSSIPNPTVREFIALELEILERKS